MGICRTSSQGKIAEWYHSDQFWPLFQIGDPAHDVCVGADWRRRTAYTARDSGGAGRELEARALDDPEPPAVGPAAFGPGNELHGIPTFRQNKGEDMAPVPDAG
jgi:hypothetical protein